MLLKGAANTGLTLGYVELPILAVVNLTKNFSIHLGGYGAYTTNANVKDVNNNGTLQSATDLNAEDFNRRDFGLAGGLGFDIENFTIGARYNYGLTDIGKSNNLTGAALGSAKNNGLSIYVGFGF